MKKIFSFFVIAFLALAGSAQSLPTAAATFLNTFFPNAEIIGVAEFQPGNTYAYRVELSPDLNVCFDANGAWGRIESFSSDISQVLSSQLKTALTDKGNNPRNVVRIVLQEGNYIITLSDGAAYIFEPNGRFIRNTVAE